MDSLADNAIFSSAPDRELVSNPALVVRLTTSLYCLQSETLLFDLLLPDGVHERTTRQAIRLVGRKDLLKRLRRHRELVVVLDRDAGLHRLPVAAMGMSLSHRLLLRASLLWPVY